MPTIESTVGLTVFSIVQLYIFLKQSLQLTYMTYSMCGKLLPVSLLICMYIQYTH